MEALLKYVSNVCGGFLVMKAGASETARNGFSYIIKKSSKRYARFWYMSGGDITVYLPVREFVVLS